MSNVDNGDLNAISDDAFSRAQQYYAAAVARWLADVVAELPTTGDEPSPTLRVMGDLLRGIADEMDAGRIAVPAEFR